MLAAFFHLVSLKTARTLLTHTRNIGRNKKIVVDSFFPVGRSVELSIIINRGGTTVWFLLPVPPSTTLEGREGGRDSTLATSFRLVTRRRETAPLCFVH